ncbi:hypothetical protein ELQ87_14180 [Streptomyces griseoviridis]|uniref:Uncharacterized protein n=1 Tax=Streptomyces griseoviridis TaxID=45398 RepID=A0A3S9ZBY5_STRGD|nr:hypothetical protein ELQ87_14180 [Streptomyces griseoviridis]QCN87827.1 hypothetical protein DDJ31_25115 [Streptomyces griseoviridis]
MRSGSDGVECRVRLGGTDPDRSTAASHGPGTGPPLLLPCRRTVGLVQRASRADGPVPSAEIRHPWFGRRPARVMPSNARDHATAQGGVLVNSLLLPLPKGYTGRSRQPP